MSNHLPPLSIRHERTVPGNGPNFGHDVTLFGVFRNDTFRVVNRSEAISLVMERGVGFLAAAALVERVADDPDVAYDVHNGQSVEL